MAQLVKCLTSAQVVNSQFMGSSPVLGSVLTAQSLEPASDSVSPSLSAPPPVTLCLSLSKINTHLKKIERKKKKSELSDGSVVLVLQILKTKVEEM